MTGTEQKNVCYYVKQICTCKLKNLLGLGFFLLLFYFLAGKTSYKYRDISFDYLLFTQRWLPTACIEYIERSSSSSRSCTLPSNFKMWAIHGLWPTKNDQMGPFFCNSSMEFHIASLEPIKRDLMIYWPNVEGDKDVASLWRHEWMKHGTCAARLDSLDTEFKYFSMTLGFYKKYNIGNVFRRYNVVPSLSTGYYVSDLLNILQSGFGKIPQIHCIIEKHTHQPYLSEIRMCFSQNLELIDCKDDKRRFGRGSGLTNCPRDRAIIYPDTSAPPALSGDYLENASKDFHARVYDILQLVKFIQWILL